MSLGIPRALRAWAFSDIEGLGAPMVFVSGARQVGKTFVARQLPASYFNLDTVEVRKAFAKDPYFFRGANRVVVFDEVHKRRDWKKLLKGYYDSPDRAENFVVTGSGRLTQYQRSGDSLQGRYHACQLWPLSPDEIHAGAGRRLQPAQPRDWRRWVPLARAEPDGELIRMGGFPAPFLSGRITTLRRWQDEYVDRLVREDVRDFSAVQRLDQMDLLARMLPDRVGAPLSVLSLARDLEASTVGVKSWIRLFEVLFLGFLLRPYHRKIHRAVKKEPKWYFQQWTFVENEGARFENYVAVQLASACSAWSEQGFGRWELFYLRDQDRREVDFLIARDLKPRALVETKLSPQNWPSALAHYCRRLDVPGFLVYPEGPIQRHERLGWKVPSGSFLRGLLLVPPGETWGDADR